MPSNFFAITDQPGDRHILRIRTSQAVQDELTALFREQSDQMIEDSDSVPFQPSDAVDDDEVFEIANFPLPEDIRRAVLSPHEFDDLILTEHTVLKSIFCTELDDDEIIVRFQSFMPQRLLSRRRTIFFSQNTYQHMDHPGLILDHKLSAIFIRDRLVFRSYHIVSRFLDLTEYFDEASDDDIIHVVSHQLFSPVDAQSIIAISTTTLRRKFMAVRKSGVLNRSTAAAVEAVALKYNLALNLADNRIVFPADRREARKLLTLLNEGYFEGELTGTRYITNWQRPVT